MHQDYVGKWVGNVLLYFKSNWIFYALNFGHCLLYIELELSWVSRHWHKSLYGANIVHTTTSESICSYKCSFYRFLCQFSGTNKIYSNPLQIIFVLCFCFILIFSTSDWYALNYGTLQISLKIIYLNGIMGDEHL